MTRDLRPWLADLVGHEGVGAALRDEPLEALELVTVDAEGWPHVAWLSAGEVLVVDSTTVAFCLWPGSTTTANLTRDGKGLLQFVVRGAVAKVRLSARRTGDIEVDDQRFVSFLAEVVDLAEDRVGYAEVLSGPTYRLNSPRDVADRWRRQLDAMEASGHDGDPGTDPGPAA